MSNVIQFKSRPRRTYSDSDLVCMFTILSGLTTLFGNDDVLKSQYVKKHCPRLSRAMAESFKDKIVLSCQEQAKKQVTPLPVPEWMTR